jgi:hypothetical protein
MSTADSDQLQTLGQQLTAALVNAYGTHVPGGNLVFLPGGVNVPDNIVQSGMINPTQLMTWLGTNFDYPFVISSADASILQRDESHGTSSQIYSLAVQQAKPAGPPGDDAWKRIAAQIAAAQASLGPPTARSMVCEPDDWPLPAAAGYWSIFDSSQSTSTSTTTKVPVVNPRFWKLRMIAEMKRSDPAAPDAAELPPAARSPYVSGAKASAAKAAYSVSSAAFAGRLGSGPVEDKALTNVSLSKYWRASADQGLLPSKLDTHAVFSSATEVETITTSTSSTIKIHLEHQCIKIARYAAGQPWWDNLFLSDPGWCVAGMSRGGLLPAPATGGEGVIYAMPVAMIAVQKLNVSGQWTQEAATALQSPGGSLGPLSLFGGSSSVDENGTITFTHPGMQVVALLCSPLPVLPPMDAPVTTAPATA